MVARRELQQANGFALLQLQLPQRGRRGEGGLHSGPECATAGPRAELSGEGTDAEIGCASLPGLTLLGHAKRPDDVRSSGAKQTDGLTLPGFDQIRTRLISLRGATSPETSLSPPHVNRREVRPPIGTLRY
jgi:hypothetical protein